MAYTALKKMEEINKKRYKLDNTVHIPDLLPEGNQKAGIREYGVDALQFIRESCVDLKFDNTKDRHELSDSDGRSVGIGQIPYNMERDLDRLSFERAILRFLKSGSREDAFDIYYCYCEIFHPFGGAYEEADTMLRMLSDHESNASSLLMKHRDHYSHSVYVFCIGLAIYKNHRPFREAYNTRFGLSEGPKAACHFLEYWGLTSLFHDVGYPFEIAHQQMKSYVCKLDKEHNDEETGFTPHVSYKGMEQFRQSSVGDLNDLFAEAITDRMGSYLSRVSVESYICHYKLREALMDRAVHDNTANKDYLYMDHAYFSGLILAKNYLKHRKGTDIMSEDSKPVLDSLCAIMLHNSLFRFTMRNFLYTKEPLRLGDGQPLTYLLMLCDELQCWDRICYGKDTRRKLYPCDFDMVRTDGNTLRLEYYFDQDAKSRKVDKTIIRDIGDQRDFGSNDAATKRTPTGRSKFLDDINKIVALKDMIGKESWNPDEVIEVKEIPNVPGKQTMSDGSYMSLYQFAVALHRDYSLDDSGNLKSLPGEPPHPADTASSDDWKKYYDGLWKVMERCFEENLSLEYKLSNIAQAKHYAEMLEKIHCFYTDRAVSYEVVKEFKPEELNVISIEEHKRWCKEKLEMGWVHGEEHMKPDVKNKKTMREHIRRHNVIGEYKEQDPKDQQKNGNAMKEMLRLLYEYDGLTIYRLPFWTTEGKQS